jgi:hypothetical protein
MKVVVATVFAVAPLNSPFDGSRRVWIPRPSAPWATGGIP